MDELRFLIVEDDENKRIQLSSVLSGQFPKCEITEAQSLMSGLRILATATVVPDLILLDMTIPNYDPSAEESGGPTHGFGGREFLIEMERLECAIPVIVVTQFSTFGKPPNEVSVGDLNNQLLASYSPPYVGIVSYNAAVHGWRERLLSLISESFL